LAIGKYKSVTLNNQPHWKQRSNTLA
jgi:hypothetical protein